ncbi:Rrf2 family transcriptional regulator [Cellulophaga sp. F20128]|uniref:RrF2 family transcriptional regulator n=1 Tax=Cellulophaga sp. F20128 TaxID=2926413 RepID=UPI001FF10337|nr:Rrf2 family transcriptional regulator [Cellulophaga sp. F20128]MCK0156768.1 Rrf2 family transcriptional regulator [Cellulophaga sp. F20128]
MFSKSCEYGLRAVLFIAQQSTVNTKVSLTTIADSIDSPQAFTAKILQQLTKSGLVQSSKGPYGGFFIEIEALSTIKLSDIVAVLDGDAIYTGCGLGLQQCNEKEPCPLHFKFIKIRDDLKQMLETNTLAIVVKDMDSDLFHLKL